MEHVNIPTGEVHGPYNWEFADSAARTAALVSDSALVGRTALQLSDMTEWYLTSAAPAVWAQVLGLPEGANFATQSELDSLSTTVYTKVQVDDKFAVIDGGTFF